MNRKFAISLATCMLLAPSISAAPLISWGESGDWAILIDPDVANGCLMEKVFTDGTRVRFGAVPSKKGGFVSLMNKDWEDVEVGKTETVKLIFGESRFAGDVEFIQDGDWKGGYAFFNNPEVVPDLAKRRSMTAITNQGTEIEVDLSGSARAITALEACQKEQPIE